MSFNSKWFILDIHWISTGGNQNPKPKTEPETKPEPEPENRGRKTNTKPETRKTETRGCPHRTRSATISTYGAYAYKNMSFGLKNASATYQRAIQLCFADRLHRNVEAYVDDVVVKTNPRINS